MMSTPIPSKSRTLSFDSAEASPQILTPAGTPPQNQHHNNHNILWSGSGSAGGAAESRLRQLLANFDAGTHSFCREERESAAERRTSFGDIDVNPKQQQPIRRPSFLSSLSLSRPLPFTSSNPSSTASTPAQTPVSTSFPHHAFGPGFSMTPARPALIKEGGAQSHSTPSVPTAMIAENAPSMTRSKTTQVVKQKGFDTSMTHQQHQQHGAEVKRHFDPSKEPRLFGLL